MTPGQEALKTFLTYYLTLEDPFPPEQADVFIEALAEKNGFSIDWMYKVVTLDDPQ